MENYAFYVGMTIEKKKWAMPIGELVHIDLDPPFGQKFKGVTLTHLQHFC